MLAEEPLCEFLLFIQKALHTVSIASIYNILLARKLFAELFYIIPSGPIVLVKLKGVSPDVENAVLFAVKLYELIDKA